MKSWIEHYRSNKDAVWIKCELTNGENIYLDKYNGWLDLKGRMSRDRLFFTKLSLQFRSHEVELNVNDCEGVYLVRSILGQIGSSVKNYFTFGRIVDNKVHKEMWIVPELIVERNETDEITDCFPEAIIYNETEKDR